jgi:signal transduction histidine kinase
MADKINLTLTKKYLAVGVIGLLGIIITFTIINTNYQNENLREQHLKQAKSLLTILKVSTAEDIYASNIYQLRQTISFVKRDSAVVEILIIDTKNKVITNGERISEEEVFIIDDPLLDASINEKKISWEYRGSTLHLFVPVELPNIHLGSIKMVYSLQELRVAELSVLLNNLKFGSVIFIVGFLLVLFFVKKIVNPIKELIAGTLQVASGNYDLKIIVDTRDELEALSESFNKMVEEVKLSRDEMISAKENAEASDKLKTEFLAQMSHEIRTPINAIVNFTRLLKSEFEYKLYGEVKESFDIIEQSSNRLIRTIDLILNMAEIQTGNYKALFEEINLYKEIILPLKSEFEISAKEKNLELISEESEKDIIVRGDKYSITQLFSNLIDNAIKYTKEGTVKIVVGKNKTNVFVDVIDTGIGIADEFLPFIYEPFLQEDKGYSRKFEGTGLGLALVKKYCEINKAEIKIDTIKNKGTTFTIMFFRTVI